MIMVFKVLEIVCYSNEISYEKASLGWNSSQYRNMKITASHWP